MLKTIVALLVATTLAACTASDLLARRDLARLRRDDPGDNDNDPRALGR